MKTKTKILFTIPLAVAGLRQIPKHIHDVSANPVILPLAAQNGELHLDFGTSLGPCNLPITIIA